MSAVDEAEAAGKRRRSIAFFILCGVALALPWLGPGYKLAAIVLGGAILGVPLFALISGIAIACFLLWPNNESALADLQTLVERINGLADTENLLAVPLFMLSGSIMARGEISARLIEFSRALIGWLPGGLAISGVVACMLFAAISGSSPATVVAIGAIMGPTLIKNGYPDRFSHGLLTSAGSLGILIPPSIPMILYPLVNQRDGIEVSRLFAAGFGPGFLIGGILGGFCLYQGLKSGAKREPFSLARLGTSILDGSWSILFPVLILGGLYLGFFTVVEAASVSVVYALGVELYVHRALKASEIPGVVQETGVILGSLLVIMVAALALSEFLHVKHVPDAAVAVIRSWDLSPVAFLLIVNLLLLVVGCLMDILSAMFLFVPLLAPIAASMGVDPIHFAIIFIVNLEIGYLTPPVGLNLFVASTLFRRPLGHIIRSVVPFIALMGVGLMVITYVPAISVGLGDIIAGTDEAEDASDADGSDDALDDDALDDDALDDDALDDDALDDDALDEGPPDDEAGGGGAGGVMTMEEMMRAAEEDDDDGDDAADDEPADDEDGAADPPAPSGATPRGRPLTMEEMMEAADVD